MEKILIFIIGAVAGGLGVWFCVRMSGSNSKDVIENQERQKQKNKQKLIDFLASKDKITNNDVEKLLGVSDASAERYLSELEKEGALRQIGEKGGWIYYEKIK